jgi:hypothetical protein
MPMQSDLGDHDSGSAVRRMAVNRADGAGGAYTYDWIENLFGLNMHSADRVLPEFQHPAPGDTIGVGKNPMRIEVIEPERVYATRSANGT